MNTNLLERQMQETETHQSQQYKSVNNHIQAPPPHLPGGVQNTDLRPALRSVGGRVTGNVCGLRPSVRDEIVRLSRLGVRPDHLWEESFIRRMSWLAFQTDREITAWLLPNGEVEELQLGERAWTDLSAVPTKWCIHAGFGERRTLPEQERLLLLHGKLSRAVSVGVGMGLPGTICMGWQSLAGTGGVILYGPIRKGQAG